MKILLISDQEDPCLWDYFRPGRLDGYDLIEDRVVTYQGLRILGLGGSALYSRGPHQYTERQMRRRIFRVNGQIRRAKGVDLIVTHAPPRGYGDDTDFAHRGFEAFLPLIDRLKPRALVHGHVHMRYGMRRVQMCGGTAVINATQRFDLILGEDAPSSGTCLSLPL